MLRCVTRQPGDGHAPGGSGTGPAREPSAPRPATKAAALPGRLTTRRPGRQPRGSRPCRRYG